MIATDLLADIGFIKGTGWGHQVWVYEGYFWVHYGDWYSIDGQRHIDGRTTDRKGFFNLFLEAVRDEVHGSIDGLGEDW